MLKFPRLQSAFGAKKPKAFDVDEQAEINIFTVASGLLYEVSFRAVVSTQIMHYVNVSGLPQL